jgi:predicted nucleic acid-binding protein
MNCHLPDPHLMDASVARNLAEAGQGLLGQFAAYTGTRTVVVAEVAEELRRAPKTSALAELHLVLDRSRWPLDIGPLPIDLMRTAVGLLRVVQVPGDRADRHLGEAATVLTAQRLGISMILMDDQWGRKLAKFRGITTIPTARLAVQLFIHDILSEGDALTLFLHSALGTTPTDFAAAVRRERAAA